MDDDLISRTELLKMFPVPDDPVNPPMMHIHAIRRIIADAPGMYTGRGTWEFRGVNSVGYHACSICGHLQLMKSNYCPYCGIEMER